METTAKLISDYGALVAVFAIFILIAYKLFDYMLVRLKEADQNIAPAMQAMTETAKSMLVTVEDSVDTNQKLKQIIEVLLARYEREVEQNKMFAEEFKIIATEFRAMREFFDKHDLNAIEITQIVTEIRKVLDNYE